MHLVEVTHSHSSHPKLSVTPNNSLLPQTLAIMTNLNDDLCPEIDSLLMYINTALCIPGECCLTIRVLFASLQFPTGYEPRLCLRTSTYLCHHQKLPLLLIRHAIIFGKPFLHAVMISSPIVRTGSQVQTWAQHVSWPPSHWICLRQKKCLWGYHG